MTIENCLTISIKDLKRKGLFNHAKTDSTLNWTKENKIFYCVGVEVFSFKNKKHLRLTHENLKNETEKYRINIITIPSNIGNGEVMYFVCPQTGKHCRKLFSCGNRFQHREAIGLLYEQQVRKEPVSYAFYLNEEQRNEPNTKNFRKYYKGKMTKRYFQILLRTSNSEVIDAYRKILDNQNNRQYKIRVDNASIASF